MIDVPKKIRLCDNKLTDSKPIVHLIRLTPDQNGSNYRSKRNNHLSNKKSGFENYKEPSPTETLAFQIKEGVKYLQSEMKHAVAENGLRPANEQHTPLVNARDSSGSEQAFSLGKRNCT